MQNELHPDEKYIKAYDHFQDKDKKQLTPQDTRRVHILLTALSFL